MKFNYRMWREEKINKSSTPHYGRRFHSAPSRYNLLQNTGKWHRQKFKRHTKSLKLEVERSRQRKEPHIECSGGGEVNNSFIPLWALHEYPCISLDRGPVWMCPATRTGLTASLAAAPRSTAGQGPPKNKNLSLGELFPITLKLYTCRISPVCQFPSKSFI